MSAPVGASEAPSVLGTPASLGSLAVFDRPLTVAVVAMPAHGDAPTVGPCDHRHWTRARTKEALFGNGVLSHLRIPFKHAAKYLERSSTKAYQAPPDERWRAILDGISGWA
jgi:hypothetical protein